jgi:protein-S-isoprenylcysteine O-methyltransferase Ste14
MLLVHQRLANFFPNNRWVQNMVGTPGILTTCMLVILIIKRRVTREEEELKKTFGKEWTQYTLETKRFIPKLI